MDQADEKRHDVAKPANQQDIGNRRALRDIRNLVGAPTYPCAVAKRGFAQTGFDGKNPDVAARHRPMTRQFAANLVSKSQLNHQVASVRNGSNGNGRQNKPNVDELLLPINKDQEEMVARELKEVEMKEIGAEPPLDIDSLDAKNPLAVVDYVDDIYNFYRETELSVCVDQDYMSRQFDINEKMRAILIDWLIEVHYKFELMDETLFLTVNLIDSFLEKKTMVRKKLQLVGVTAMLLACKYEEVLVPVVEDLILISDRAYTRDEVLEMEKLMVNTLQFNLSVPTSYVFMRRFLKAAQSDRKLELVSFFIIELSLVEYQMLKFRPSLLAAAAIYTAQCSLKGIKHWTKTSELHTRYSEEQLLECSRMMVKFHQNAGKGKLTGVYKKYSTVKFGCAANCEPALFLLD